MNLQNIISDAGYTVITACSGAEAIEKACAEKPDIIFMDEPLSGLDANAVIIVKRVLQQLAKEGKTIFYSSHIMDVVEKISDRIILIDNGVVLADGNRINAKAVVLTTGTFLRGVIHIGDVARPGGRLGDRPSIKLAERIDSFDLPLGRLKTGTPPRLDSTTIRWDALEMQPGDDEPVLFSFLSAAPM